MSSTPKSKQKYTPLSNTSNLPMVAMQRFSKYETKTALTDDLFVSLPRHKINKLDAWEIRKDIGDLHLRFEGTRRLTVQDETVLLAVLGLLGQSGTRVLPGEAGPFQNQSIDMLKAKSMMVGLVRATRWKLLELCGLTDTGPNYQQLMASLNRLSTVSVFYRNQGTKWEGRDWFMGFDAAETGELLIKVNWRLAGAVFGDYHFISLDMTERLKLSSDSAKKLHVVLSRHVWHGRRETFKLDTLIGHVWSDKDVTEKTTEKRRAVLKRALEEIGEFRSWRIVISGRGAGIRVAVERARLPDD